MLPLHRFLAPKLREPRDRRDLAIFVAEEGDLAVELAEDAARAVEVGIKTFRCYTCHVDISSQGMLR